MYRPSRTRRILKWTGAGLSLFVFATWFATLFYIATFGLSRHTGLFFGVGGVAFETAIVDDKGGFGAAFIGPHRWFGWGLDSLPINLLLELPLGKNEVISAYSFSYWFLFVITAIPTIWLWYRDRRRIGPGCCARCGYDLTGNTSGICSECGMARPTNVQPTRTKHPGSVQKANAGSRLRDWLYPELKRLDHEEERQRTYVAACLKLPMGPWLAAFWLIGFVVAVSAVLYAANFSQNPTTIYGWASSIFIGTFFLTPILVWILHHQRLRRMVRRQLAMVGVRLCLRCGYDLTGNTSGVCSECGEKIDKGDSPPRTA